MRPPNLLKYKQLKYPGNSRIEEYLSDLVSTGLFGSTPSEAAGRLVTDGIERAIQAGTITRRDQISKDDQS
jgi:hypothetical protein